MSDFTKPIPAALSDFNVRLVVREVAGAPVVDILFSIIVVDADGQQVQRPAGDARPLLTAQQQAGLEAVATSLYTRAKARLLT